MDACYAWKSTLRRLRRRMMKFKSLRPIKPLKSVSHSSTHRAHMNTWIHIYFKRRRRRRQRQPTVLPFQSTAILFLFIVINHSARVLPVLFCLLSSFPYTDSGKTFSSINSVTRTNLRQKRNQLTCFRCGTREANKKKRTEKMRTTTTSSSGKKNDRRNFVRSHIWL